MEFLITLGHYHEQRSTIVEEKAIKSKCLRVTLSSKTREGSFVVRPVAYCDLLLNNWNDFQV